MDLERKSSFHNQQVNPLISTEQNEFKIYNPTTINDEKFSKKSNSTRTKFKLCGESFPKSEVVFFAQVILIYFVVVISLYNLTFQPEKYNLKLWVALLSSSVGYLLPNPSIYKN